ncbi:MAG TPA: NADP-dependent oxidoreductase [Polyangiaceae bacterium]|nr:NADP-dependent oxidoreductase [Polyangiaceae bacterium]
MKRDVNRQWRLASRPKGMVSESNFQWVEEPVRSIENGEILVRSLLLSCDPTQRMWMAQDTYMPAVAIGEVMRSAGIGVVEESRHRDFAPEDIVSGLLGWQDYAVMTSSGLARPTKIPPGVPLPVALSALGHTGLTAYFGLLDIGKIREGETVVVSGAAGATGSMACQIAKIKGCRVIGIAGGPEKCKWLTDELGVDGAIDYKSEDVAKRLRELCPKGIDVYFDNVGGEILDAALGELAMRGRVVICGGISGYNSDDLPAGPRKYMNLLIKRGRMEGFLVSDYFDRAGEAIKDIGGWARAGKIKDRVEMEEGLENAPKALQRIFKGENMGKQLVKVGDL